MKIRQLTATFGKLRQQTLELKDGLNIIEAPNESGKSTWAGFLRAMLYGINTRERDKGGFIAEKNLYQPWDGGAMEGSARLNWNGREITLRRTSKGSSPLSQFQAVYTGTEEPVPGLTADGVGEVLTGVGREVFERSAFVGQSAITVTGSAELERRISAIVSSGQEDVSYSETEEQLRKWKNYRQSNVKNGQIPRLEEERAEVAATLARLERARQQAADARAQILVLSREKDDLERLARDHRSLTAARSWENYQQALSELESAQKALDAVRREQGQRGSAPEESALRGMQGDLSYLNALDENMKQARREIDAITVPSQQIPHPVFSGMDPAAARERAQADLAALRAHAPQKFPFWIVLCLAVLAVAGGFLLPVRPLLPLLWAGLCILGICTVIVIHVTGNRRRSTAVARILNAYGAQAEVEITEQAEAYSAQWEQINAIRTDAVARAVALERLEAEREVLAGRLLNAVHTFAPEVTDLFGVSAAVSLALNLRDKERTALLRLESAEKLVQAITIHGVPEQAQAPAQIPQRSEQEISARLGFVNAELARQNEALAMAQGEMNTLGDPAALQARLGELELRLKELRLEYDAIVLAMDTLKQANAALQERMSPALNRRAGELFHRLTGGVYDQVSLTREFEALAARSGDVTPRKLLTLSRGTADQLYLAVRLAVCDLVLDGEDPAPLVLDDALVNFDDRRLALALDLLRELAGQRQILLFTCQSRERLCLEGADDVHLIRLNS